MKRNNVYAKADEKFVKVVKVYANESNVLYLDEAATAPILTTDLEELFLKKIAIVKGTTILIPIAYTSTGVVTYDGENAVTFTATAPTALSCTKNLRK